MKAIKAMMFLSLVACASKREEPNSIREKLMTKASVTRQCYLESDTFNKRQPLKLKFHHEIASDGSTLEHAIKDQEPKDPNFTSCFLTQMKDLKYQMPLVLPSNPKDETIMLEPTGNIHVIQAYNFIPGF